METIIIIVCFIVANLFSYTYGRAAGRVDGFKLMHDLDLFSGGKLSELNDKYAVYLKRKIENEQ